MASETKENEAAQKSGYQFGTFKGVFTPSILTILGVVMYLRFGWVLGNVGLPATLLIVTMACMITFLTGLALGALATNMKVGGGGAYYIISRSLGVEAGAAIGVPLFFAQALGIAFYVIGFSEAFVNVLPIASVRMVATCTLAVLGIMTYFSADLALRAQFIVMTLVFASLASFFMGGAPTDMVPPDVVVPAKKGFWMVFAVFFPAVTGIEAGLSMSGDLKNPAKSLPLGTLGAVGVGYIIYIAIPIFLAVSIKDNDVLLTNTFIMRNVARWGSLAVAGVWAAALSSAVGALLGAPRTLQALARDRVIPRFIGRGFGKGGDPRIASLIALLVAVIGIWLGDLNLIAPLLTMFFLTSYGLLNLSAGLEELIGSPSWHPTLRIPAGVCLFAAAACMAVMLMINTGATFAAMAVSGTVFFVMKRRSMKVQWGDMRYGLLMLLARQSIRHLAASKPDERSWRPNILVLSGSPTARWHLIGLAGAIGHGEGCLTVATVIPTHLWSAEKEESLADSIRNYMLKRDIAALAKVLPADDMISGAESLIRAYGFGPIVPNTILLGETGQEDTYARFARLIQLVYKMKRNLVLVREGEPEQNHTCDRIDIWWRGERENIGLMLSLASLLKRNLAWSKARIIVKTVATTTDQADEARLKIDALIQSQCVMVELDVVRAEPGDVFGTIRRSSEDASLVLVGMRAPTEDIDTDDEYVDYYRKLLASTDHLPTTAIVLAAEGIDYLRILGRDNA